MDKFEKVGVIYTAHSKYNFYARKMISAYVLEHNYLPLNPFTNWDYFLNDMVNRELIIRANNNLIYKSDELWQFGEISDGCYQEIELAMKLGIKIRFFSVGKKISDIKELNLDQLTFEDELKNKIDVDECIKKIKDYRSKL